MQKNIDDAINLITSTIKLNREDKSPYFFIVGAGISMPEISSSTQIIDNCKSVVKKQNPVYFEKCIEKSENAKDNPMKYYSEWVSFAFPNKKNRSDFFKNIIKQAKISSANLMLAQVLHSRVLGTTVFTPNFDDKLKQSLDLIGEKEVFVSENSMDNLVVTTHSSDIQIVHVHGTYNFYDCANLETEISNVSNQRGTISSTQVLTNFLQGHAPIIIGYSGWEKDVIMSSLKERLNYPTPFTYIWVCYSQEAYTQLPQWLTSSENVIFILPEEQIPNCSDTEKNKFLENDNINTIPATMFLSKVISSFKMKAPLILSNPSAYYSNVIHDILPDNEDVLHLKHWAKRMELQGLHNSEYEKSLKELEVASISKDFEVASEIIKKMSNIKMTDIEIKFLCLTLFKEFVANEKIINSSEVKINFNNSILDFTQSNHEQLLKAEVLEELLESILMAHTGFSSRQQHIDLVDRILELSKSKESLLKLWLTALGVKSSIVNNEKIELELLELLLANIPLEISNDKQLQHIKFTALLQLAEIKQNQDAIEILEKAEDLLSAFNTKRPKSKFFLAKSAVIKNIDDLELSYKFTSDVVDYLDNLDDLSNPYFIAKMVSNISELPDEILSKFDAVDEKLVSFLDKCKNLDVTQCNNCILLANIYSILCIISNNEATKFDFCNKIFDLESNFPCECASYKEKYLKAIFVYCALPISIVADSLKIDKLIHFKKFMRDLHPKHASNLFYSILSISAELGDERKYRSSDLANDLFQCENIEKFSQGVTFYKEKNFYEAEKIFTYISNHGDGDVSQSAIINLAFMLRRGETIDCAVSFDELISSVSNDYPLKHINIILWCKYNDKNESLQYINSIESLKQMNSEQLEEITDCWKDIDLVGEAESKLVFEVLDSIK